MNSQITFPKSRSTFHVSRVTLHALTLLTLLTLRTHATTVTGNLTDISLAPLNTKLEFAPTNDVLVTGDTLNAGPPRIIDTTNGAFTVSLAPGDYSVSLPLVTWRKPFLISVMDTNATLNITDLLAEPKTYTYTNNLNFTLKATSSDAGPDVLDAKLNVGGTLTKTTVTNGGAISLLLSNSAASFNTLNASFTNLAVWLTDTNTHIVLTNASVAGPYPQLRFVPGTNSSSIHWGDPVNEDGGYNADIFWNPQHTVDGGELQIGAPAIALCPGGSSIAPNYRQNRRLQLGAGDYHHPWVDMHTDSPGGIGSPDPGCSLPLRWEANGISNGVQTLMVPAMQANCLDTNGGAALTFYDRFEVDSLDGTGTNWNYALSPVRGRMLIGKGWSFRGAVIEEKMGVTANSNSCALDFGKAQCVDITVNVTNVTFSATNATGAATNFERRTFVIRSGGNAPSLIWPNNWCVLGNIGGTSAGSLPTNMVSGQLLRLQLESVGPGDSNILACAQLATDNAFVWDPDALNYFSRAGITDALQKSAVNQMALSLKGTGSPSNLWSRLYAVYPFCGSSSNACSQNLITNKYGVAFSSAGVAYNSMGIQGNGGSSLGNTFFTNTVTTNFSIGVCLTVSPSDTNAINNGGVFIGCYESAGHSWIETPYSTIIAGDMAIAASGVLLATKSTGVFIASRTNSAGYVACTANGTIVATAAASTLASHSVPVCLMCDKPVPDQNSDAVLGMAFIGQGFTSTDVQTLNAIFTAYKNAMGR